MTQIKKLIIPACPVETTLTILNGKWKPLILRELLTGTKRFSEIQKGIGSISKKVLTQHLREMEERNLLTRKVYPEVPPRVEYSLTDLGESLRPVIKSLWSWGEFYKKTLRN